MDILKGLQYESGLFAASRKDVPTGYDKSWLRDNFYECLAFQAIDDWETIRQTMRAILQIFEKHEEKIDQVIEKKPEHKHEYIHARFNPENFEEFWDDWGNKQNDSIGAILFLLGELEAHKASIIETEKDLEIIQKLVQYLGSIEYWQDKDSGMWEENEEVHASSVGACVAGLRSVTRIPGIDVPDELMVKGEETLLSLLPRESETKFADLAELSLIWPYHVVTPDERDAILENLEYHLLREHGVIRYKNDHYYNKNPDGYSEEAEWCFGLSWLAIIYDELSKLPFDDAKKAGYKAKRDHFITMMLGSVAENGAVPELYFSHSDKHNENTPLGWAESLFVLALYHLGEKGKK
jgi:phosphorylase kinase alpha/beta subunit